MYDVLDYIVKKKKKKKKKIPTYLPTSKNLGRVTPNRFFFKVGLIITIPWILIDVRNELFARTDAMVDQSNILQAKNFSKWDSIGAFFDVPVFADKWCKCVAIIWVMG